MIIKEQQQNKQINIQDTEKKKQRKPKKPHTEKKSEKRNLEKKR